MEETPEQVTKSEKPMKSSTKQFIIIGAVVVLILLGVGSYFVLGQKTSQTTTPPAANTVTPTETKGMFDSIQDALSKSLSLQCIYEEDGKKTTAYIKAGSVRADMSGGTTEENGSVIVKDNTMYFWNGKEGMMMKFDPEAMKASEEKMTSPKTNAPTSPNADFMEDLEKYKDACKPATVSDTLFTPPTDVKFVDQTKMIEDAQKMMKAVTPGQSMSEEDVKKLMQQYQQAQ